MNLKQLSQLYYLNREIELDQQRLEELRAKAERLIAPKFDSMPRGGPTINYIEKYVTEIVDLTAIVQAKQQQCICERNRLESYIAGINDSLVRMIFTLRFINGLSWEQVAKSIDEKLTDSYVRLTCHRYIKRTK